MFVKGMKGNIVAVKGRILPVCLCICMMLLCGCGGQEVSQVQMPEQNQPKPEAAGVYITIEEEEVPLAAIPAATEDVLPEEELEAAEALTMPEESEKKAADAKDEQAAIAETMDRQTDAPTTEQPQPAKEVEVLLNEEDSPMEVIVESEEQVTLEEGVLTAVNEARAAKGLTGLTVTPELSAAAAKRAEEIAGSFSHTRPCGTDYHTAVTEAGGNFGSIGENLFRGMDSVDAVKNAWNGSEVHLENILNGGFAHIGIGVAETPGGVYVVQIFTD